MQAANPRRWAALGLIALAQFMVIMDTSIIGVALPEIQADVGFTPEWHDPFISAEGLETYGVSFFENYLANPQSKLLRLAKTA